MSKEEVKPLSELEEKELAFLYTILEKMDNTLMFGDGDKAASVVQYRNNQIGVIWRELEQPLGAHGLISDETWNEIKKQQPREVWIFKNVESARVVLQVMQRVVDHFTKETLEDDPDWRKL